MDRCVLCHPDCKGCAWDRGHPNLEGAALVGMGGGRLLCQAHAALEEHTAAAPIYDDGSSMLLVDGPARGEVVTGDGMPMPWVVEPDARDALHDTARAREDRRAYYYPRRLLILGRSVWVGVSGDEMPEMTSLFDLLMSDAVKQCADT